MPAPSSQPQRLSQVLADVKSTLQSTVGSASIWFRAELAKVTHHSNGHCYVELVEQQQHRTTAKAAGVIWSRHLADIRASLAAEYTNIVKQGVEIVCLGRVTFHELYGFQIQITAIDPTFNLGAMELRKQQALQRLIAEGLIDKNRQIAPPLVLQRVALIASPTSAGIQDFIQQVEQNKYGYKIHVTVFAATVQGESAPASMLEAYRQIDTSQFDMVAVIRGGGSKLDLEPFNNYQLSAVLASCPIPVMTGIGHDVDHSVLDEVAYMMHKTPTALAAYVVDQVHEFEYALLTSYLAIVRTTVAIVETGRKQLEDVVRFTDRIAMQKIQSGRQVLHTHAYQITHISRTSLQAAHSDLKETTNQLRQHVTQRVLHTEPTRLAAISTTLQLQVQALVQRTADRLQYIESAMVLAHPQKVLERGFSVSRVDGKAITSIESVDTGDMLHTQVSDGIIISTITDKQKRL